MVTHGLLERMNAQSSRVAETEQFLLSAMPQVQSEPATTAWFALRFGRGEYGIFDAFEDEGARLAHLQGPLATALIAQAPNLLEKAPNFQTLEIVASKLPPDLAPENATCGLLISFNAKEGNEAKVEQFLRDALPLVRDEQGTMAWFALRWPQRRFGIFDVFPDHGSRFAHLTGHVPRELVKHAFTLLGGMPSMDMVDVLAVHVAHRTMEVGLGVD